MGPLAVALLCAVLPQDDRGLPPLALGEEVRGAVSADEPAVSTARLAVLDCPDLPTRARAWRLELADDGPVVVELRSWHFDAYLVLRDPDGAVVAEDDDGLYKRHARLAVDLVAGVPYRLEACARHGETGPFTLLARRGPAPPPSREAALAEIRAAQRGAEAAGDERALAWALMSEVHQRLGQGDFDGSGPLVERVLELRERLYGPDHPLTFGPVDELAVLWLEDGRMDDVIAVVEEQLRRRAARFGPAHPDLAWSHNSLARACEWSGRIAQACEHYRLAIELLRPWAALRAGSLVSMLADLAYLENEQGHPDVTRALLDEALEVGAARLEPEDPRLGNVWNALGFLHEQAGRPAEAERASARAIAIFSKALGPDHPFTATVRANRAMQLEALGRLKEARPELEAALAIHVKVYGREHVVTATTMGSLGWLHRLIGNEERARELLSEARDVLGRLTGPSYPLYALLTADLAEVTDDRQESIELFRRAIELETQSLGPTHPRTLIHQSFLARQLARAGRMEEALDMLREARAILLEEREPNDPYLSMVTSQLADVLCWSGALEEATPLYEEVVATREATFGPAHIHTLRGAQDLARNLVDTGDLAGAWARLARSGEGRRGVLEHSIGALTEAECFRFLADMRGQLELELSLAPALGPEAERVAYSHLLDWKGRATRELWTTGRRRDAQHDGPERQLLDELRATQALLSRALLGRDEEAPDDAALAELRQRRADLELRLAALARPEDAVASHTAAELAAALPEGTALLDVFVHRTWRADPRGGDWTDQRTTAWILRPGAELVRVDLGSADALEAAVRAHLSAIAGRRGIAVGDAGGGAREAAGAQLRALLWDPLAPHLEGVERLFVCPDGALATLPFGTLPLEDGRYLVERLAVVYLQDAVTVLRLAEAPPAGHRHASLLSVGGVDFLRRAQPEADAAALADGAPASDPGSGVDAASFSAESNAPPETETGAETDPSPPALRSPVGAAAAASSDSEADAVSRGGLESFWSRLPATRGESQAVADLHALFAEEVGIPAEQLLLQGADATEERLKRELPTHAVAHLATHGFFQPEGVPSLWQEVRGAGGRVEVRLREEGQVLLGSHPGLLSGLVCAGANRSQPDDGLDDGYLTAEEVSWLDLSGTDLVVLSACDTALGRARSGEGLMGLRRAFEVAGARTVISSLWSVSDEATGELMLAFYRNLWLEGRGVSDALRAAQLELLRQRRASGGDGDPASWGAFVVSGEWR